MQSLSDLSQGIKAWFKHSETIFLARAELIVGFMIAAMSAMDWSPIMGIGDVTGMTWRQGATIGSIMVAKGIISELARRRNTVEVGERLLPTEAIVKEAVVAEEKVIETKEKKVEEVK